MWKRILEPLRKKLKGENGVRLVMLLGIAGLALILLSGFLPDKAEKQTDAASVQSAETASQEQAEQYVPPDGTAAGRCAGTGRGRGQLSGDADGDRQPGDHLCTGC